MSRQGMPPAGVEMDDVRVYTGTLIADLVLQEAHSLKDRRKPLRALVQRLRNHDFSVAQVGPADLMRRVFLAISVVSMLVVPVLYCAVAEIKLRK